MTVKWERFAGDTDIFAIRLAFMSDPDVGSFADPEDAASWGAFQLWINGQNLCSYVDQGEILHSAHWYLLPLLEWFVENWNAILHEERLPNRSSSGTAVAALGSTRTAPALAGEMETIAWDEERYGWRTRHALRSARAGGLLPNVVIRRVRDFIEFSWDDEPVAGAPVGFRYNASAGVALIDPGQVAATLFEIVSAAISYLVSTGGADRRVAALTPKLNSLRTPEQHEQRLGWLAGLREMRPTVGRLHGAFSETEVRTRWVEIVTSLKDLGNGDAAAAALEVEESALVITGSCQAALLFSSTAPHVTSADVRTLAAVLVEQYVDSSPAVGVDELVENSPLLITAPAWEQGYELADTLHASLRLDLSHGWVDVAEVLEQLGVTMVSRKLEDHSIRSCCLVGPRHVPTVVQNETSPYYRSANAQRFNLAHELCHLLFDRSRGRKVSIASGPWAPRGIERRANAFAAMFLMPTELVEEAVADVADPISEPAAVSSVADKLHVSRQTVIDHLYNLTLMTEADRDDLLRQTRD
ncbi:MAG: ImmA/IrrE family metallo-endopeptidase [Pseudonocardia sp.]